MTVYELKDLSGNTFGIWKVIRLDHVKYNGTNHKHGMSYYRCECIRCGAVKLMPRSSLTQSKNSYHRNCRAVKV